MKPIIGQMVHYVSHGTPTRGDGTQAYTSECRAAFVTELTSDPTDPGQVGLCVLNPTGQFFNRGVPFHDGREKPGEPRCPNSDSHGNPFRYCACGWSEASYVGGTWHWPEHTDD